MESVSIALATYNGEAHLPVQLESFLAQSKHPDELVIVDDHSSDQTWPIVNKFKNLAPFDVKVSQNEEQLGVTKTFERALSKTTGSIIFLADQDDKWHPKKIERVTETFREHAHISLVIHDVRYHDRKLKKSFDTKIERFRNLGLSTRNYVTGMATAVRRDLLDLALPFPPNLGVTHDRWLHLLAEETGSRMIFPVELASYRRHEANATKTAPLNPAEPPTKTLFALKVFRGRVSRLPKLRRILKQRQALQIEVKKRVSL